MVNKTNKIIISLVIFLIILLILSIVLAVTVINNNNKNAPESISKENSTQVVEIQEIESKEENEVLVAYLDGDPNEENNENVIIIGEDGNYNEEINNIVENNSSPYYIKINVQANVVTIYKKDGDGNYNIPLKAMVCSCGTATPIEGTYSLKKYNNWEWKTLYGGYGRYATQISGDILFSSVPYSIKGDKTSLKYEEYDKLGTISSVGNILLTVRDAKWIYDNCQAGTQVTFYVSEIPSPINVNTTQLITEDIQVRGWDPTDPDDENPWKNYVRPEATEDDTKAEDNNSQDDDLTLENNTTQDNSENVTQENNTMQNNLENALQNSTQVNNTVSNTVENNDSNNVSNDVTDNSTQNNVNETQNNVVENRVLEQNNDVTIKSEIIDTSILN